MLLAVVVEAHRAVAATRSRKAKIEALATVLTASAPDEVATVVCLLTGEPRSATIRAENDCEVLEISKPVMAEVLRESPEYLSALSELLAKRKLEGEGIVKESTAPPDEKKETEYRSSFLRRLRTVFEL